uniref:UspA domain-containing protein n=1 Tax=Azospirillum brasilense TaxID=192 RepID=O86058_AZOBR|nr:unknown [Azospirillum brasilense]
MAGPLRSPDGQRRRCMDATPTWWWLGRPIRTATVTARSRFRRIWCSNAGVRCWSCPTPALSPTSGNRRVLVAWNGSREAARAVADAMPILTAAKRVVVMAVNPKAGPAGIGDEPGADIAKHLSRHGCRVEATHIVTDQIDPGDTLLNTVADESCDLLVMGAYARSRVREQVLGGMTRYMLEHMTVPVLMSH